MGELSPMMRQYMEIKERNKDCILFFRLGDFYEMFFEDAEVVSEELDLVLTGKDCGLEERAPMCGVPFHSAENYIEKLISLGHKVAICEQTEDPAKAKGLVKRDIIRIITPGTVIEDTMLEEGKNNYLAAVSIIDGKIGICFSDASTGEAEVTEIFGENAENRAIEEIERYNPAELLINESDRKNAIFTYFSEKSEVMVTLRDKTCFEPANAERLILAHFNAVSVENLGLVSASAAVSALGAVINYLYEMGITGNITVNKVAVYTTAHSMRLDQTAIRNLEITETMRNKSRKGALLWVMDKTRTAMGKRLIRSWLEAPLIDIIEINSRQNAVEELYNDAVMRGEAREYLVGVKDIQRIMTKIVYGTGNARDLRALSSTIHCFPGLKNAIASAQSGMISKIYEDIDDLTDIMSLIDESIVDEPPAVVREGGMIRQGYNSTVDELNYAINHGTDLIAEIEQNERERTGIKNLKVKYNKVFGYYIEVTNSFLDKVPEDYVRKQTLTGAERFITDDLKKLEAKVLGSRERVVQLEYELFDEIRKTVANQINRFQKTASAIARLDTLCSLSEVAANNNYCRPKINTDGTILIKSGRHPVVEQLSKTPFVANDTYLNSDTDRCAIITGPNMAGKSTFMRQVAIIVILAQVGSFVPAESANIGICDAVFTRVGASDDLASGQSTFMVEMSEVASILKNATKNSLLILDEIGRGTSTYDGMSIAKAVLEHVNDKRKLGAKTLFATHYHELTEMEHEVKGVKNYNIAVKKRGDDIIFLRRIVPGGADDSYGVQVAKLAGIPNSVIERAKAVLKDIESNGVVTYKTVNEGSAQMPIELQNAEEILKELKILDVNTLTPIEAMGVLFDIVNKAKSV